MHNIPDEKQSEVRMLLSLFVVLALIWGMSTLMAKPEREVVENIDLPNPFEKVELAAKSAFVYDSRTGRALYSKNENQRLPLASLTKVMSALVATEIVPEYSTVVVRREALESEGDSGLRAGERWTLKELLDFTLTNSSNDGMRAVALALGSMRNSNPTLEEAETDFITLMNAKASELGMRNTYFFNETGLDETDTKGGAYGSARDMATLFEYILIEHPGLLEATKEDVVNAVSADGRTYRAVNTDVIVGEIPGLRASKTGYTDIAGGNLVVAFDPEIGRTIIVSVLGSTREGRFSDTQKLVNAAIEFVRGASGQESISRR